MSTVLSSCAVAACQTSKQAIASATLTANRCAPKRISSTMPKQLQLQQPHQSTPFSTIAMQSRFISKHNNNMSLLRSQPQMASIALASKLVNCSAAAAFPQPLHSRTITTSASVQSEAQVTREADAQYAQNDAQSPDQQGENSESQSNQSSTDAISNPLQSSDASNPIQSSDSSSPAFLRNRVFSPRTVRRQEVAAAQPFHISHAEFRHSLQPFPARVLTKLPVAMRIPKGAYLIKQLEAEERNRLLANYPRHFEPFSTGDAICVTKLLSLTDRAKRERLYGVVIARSGSYPHDLNANFTLRNVRDNEAYELIIPYLSPFIVRIDVMQKSLGDRRVKQYEFRSVDRARCAIKPNKGLELPEDAHAPKTIYTKEEQSERLKAQNRQIQAIKQKEAKEINRARKAKNKRE